MTDHSFHQAHPGLEVSVKPGMAHSSLDYQSPIDYETHHEQKDRAA
jgi:hypothetical protein